MATQDKVAVRLLTSDQLYSDTRYLHMIPVGKILQEGARAQKQLRTDFDTNFSGASSNLQGKKLTELREFVTRMSNQNAKTQTLSTHLELAFCIKHQLTSTYDMYLSNQLSMLFSPVLQDALHQIDERIAWKDNIFCILRYLSIITHSLGPQLKRKDYDLIKKDLIQTFGLQYLVLIHALEQVGILLLSDTNKSSSSIKTNETNFERLKREFNLLQDDQTVNVSDPQDINYIYYQYAPISVRLIERIIFPTSSNIQETMNMLSGTTFIDTQQVPMELKRHRHGSTTSISSLNKSNKQQTQQQQQSTESKVTLVVFVGGITYGEIAALRFLADRNQDFVIATTHFINGTDLMKSLLDVPILPL
jgi:lysine-specific histone demethylase 1